MTQQTTYDNVPVYTGQPMSPAENGFFQPPSPTAGAGHALASVDEFRAIAEVQASMAIAKRFPRDEYAAYTRIMNACKRPSLAENAAYAYPRGGTTVTGPSIRLAEVLANAWGNIDYGYREVGSGQGYTDVEAYAFDKESNSRSCRTFRVQHIRSTKQGNKNLTDPRDVYELVANQASRRIRACILQIIPGDVTEEALKSCETTIKKSGGDAPLVDRVRKMATAFQEFGVTTEMLERRLGHKLDATIEQELVQLRRIYTSIKDGATKREEFFDLHSAPPEGGKQPSRSENDTDKQTRNTERATQLAALSTLREEAKTAWEATGSPLTEAETLINVFHPKWNTAQCQRVLVEAEKRQSSFTPEQTNAPEQEGEVMCPNTNSPIDDWKCAECRERNGCPAWTEE